jgi:lambda repressor-like predicted transcriptional regulator
VQRLRSLLFISLGKGASNDPLHSAVRRPWVRVASLFATAVPAASLSPVTTLAASEAHAKIGGVYD